MSMRTQDFAPSYFDAGVCAVFSPDQVLSTQWATAGTRYLGYRLPKSKAIDIDDVEDWEMAEAIYRGRVVPRSGLSEPDPV